jgi:restriction endonuclease S subunit
MYYFNMRYSCSSTDTEPVIQLLLFALQCMFNNYSHIIQYSSLNIIFKKYLYFVLHTHKRYGMESQD